MSLQIGHNYVLKTYIHGFLDEITVMSCYRSGNSNTYVVLRSNGHIYNITEEDLRAADYYRIDTTVGSDDDTAALTDMEDYDDDYTFDPNEILID